MSADFEAARSAFLQAWWEIPTGAYSPEDIAWEIEAVASAMRQLAVLRHEEGSPRVRRLIGGAAP